MILAILVGARRKSTLHLYRPPSSPRTPSKTSLPLGPAEEPRKKARPPSESADQCLASS